MKESIKKVGKYLKEEAIDLYNDTKVFMFWSGLCLAVLSYSLMAGLAAVNTYQFGVIKYIENVNPQMLNKPDFYYQHMFEEIKEAAGEKGKDIKLYIKEKDTINAYTDGKNVYFYRGFLKLLNTNPDGIAMIMSHEIAHIQLKHATWSQFFTCRVLAPMCEKQADRLGRDIMDRTNKYDACKGAISFQKIHRIYGSIYKNSSHPPAIHRAIDMCTSYEEIDKPKEPYEP